MNFVKGTVAEVGDGETVVSVMGLTVAVPRPATGAAPGQAISVGLRPQHISLAADGDGVPVEVALVEALGSETVIHSRTGTGERLQAVLAGQHALWAGESVRLTFAPANLHLFDEVGLRLA